MNKMNFELNLPKNEETPVPVIRLELCHSSSGVDVVAFTEDGRKHFLLTFLHDGRFHRCVHIDENSGFKINKYGQLVECKNL